MSKVRIGVLGGYRGKTMINWCITNRELADVVAICDMNPDVRENVRSMLAKSNYECTLYEKFDDFLNHDMDAVVLANFANEHAPFAIRCLERGLHVFSEVLPCANMKEAVELCEAVERYGKIYAYGENYCYFPSMIEMKKEYELGKIGEFEYGEGEYVHDCESIWPRITYGDPDHWRNQMSAFFYCTHSAGPIIHTTGLRPVSVSGFELPYAKRHFEMGAQNSGAAVEMVTLENGGVFKSLHFNIKGHNTWYNMYGSKGRMETGRQGFDKYSIHWLYEWAEQEDKTVDYAFYRPSVGGEPFEGRFGKVGQREYRAISDKGPDAKSSFGHAGSDYYSMENFVKAIVGDESADIIGVYEALDMFFVGHFGYLSALDGSIPKKIPNFRNKEEREAFRNDTSCSIVASAGDMPLPFSVKEHDEIPAEVYEKIADKFYGTNKERKQYGV